MADRNKTTESELQLPRYMQGGTQRSGAKRTAALHAAALHAAASGAPKKPASGSAASGKSTPKAPAKPAAAKASAPKAQRKPAAAKAAAPKAQKKAAQPVKPPAKKAAAPKRKRESKHLRATRRTLVMLIGLVGVLLVGVWLVSLLGRAAEKGPVTVESLLQETERFPEDAEVLDVAIGGKTRAAAKTAVERAAEEALAAVDLTVECGSVQRRLNAEALGMRYDVESALNEAMAGAQPEETAGVVDLAAAADHWFSYDKTKLESAVADIAAEVNQEPVNAKAVAELLSDHTVSFAYQDGQSGMTLDQDGLLQKLTALLDSGTHIATVPGEIRAEEPEITTALLKENSALISTYTTTFAAGRSDEIIQNRCYNIEKAAGIINGCTVLPGEEWSFNGFVGLRTYESGWKGANGIAYGVSYTVQAGGGICQVSSTLYNALLCGNIEVTDRRAHTIPSEYVPKGLDATVDSTGIDLKFRNNTGAPLYLFAYIEDVPDTKRYDQITFLLYGQPLPEGVTYKTRSEVVEVLARDSVDYTDDDTIPRGYKIVTVEKRDGYRVEAYLDKYVNGELKESTLIHTDKYSGNNEKARRGSGSPKYVKVPDGAVPIG